MAFKKYVKKVARRVRGKAIKRYFNKGYKPKIGRIMKDVKYLKSVLNPEKKLYQYNLTDTLFGQCNINNSAYYVSDITPVPAQGTTSVTRNGNSIKLHTARIKMQLQSQSGATGNAIKVRGMVVQVLGSPYTSASTLVSTMFKPNSFVTGGTIYDYNSDRREDSFKQFRIIRSFNANLPANNHTGQVPIKNVSIGIRFKNHHVKFVSDGATNIQDGQIFLIMFADSGNISTTTASSLVGTGVTATSTGVWLQQDTSIWFYDN